MGTNRGVWIKTTIKAAGRGTRNAKGIEIGTMTGIAIECASMIAIGTSIESGSAKGTVERVTTDTVRAAVESSGRRSVSAIGSVKDRHRPVVARVARRIRTRPRKRPKTRL